MHINGTSTNITFTPFVDFEGVVPWIKIYDSTILATNQGSVRRGAASVNLHVNHPDQTWGETPRDVRLGNLQINC